MINYGQFVNTRIQGNSEKYLSSTVVNYCGQLLWSVVVICEERKLLLRKEILFTNIPT